MKRTRERTKDSLVNISRPSPCPRGVLAPSWCARWLAPVARVSVARSLARCAGSGRARRSAVSGLLSLSSCQLPTANCNALPQEGQGM